MLQLGHTCARRERVKCKEVIPNEAGDDSSNLVWFLAVGKRLPHEHAKAPHVTFGWKLEVVYTLRSVPFHRPLPMTFSLEEEKHTSQQQLILQLHATTGLMCHRYWHHWSHKPSYLNNFLLSPEWKLYFCKQRKHQKWWSVCESSQLPPERRRWNYERFFFKVWNYFPLKQGWETFCARQTNQGI